MATPSAQAILDLLRNPRTLPAATAMPQGVTVTTWTVGYDSQGNLTASCLVTPDAGIDISFCGIALYEQDANMTIITAGMGGVNDEHLAGLETVWGANAITAVYPQGKGTTVTSVVLGFATYSNLRVFLFQQDFQL